MAKTLRNSRAKLLLKHFPAHSQLLFTDKTITMLPLVPKVSTLKIS